ncbi:MAG: LamG domain-containing protein, partial [Patescibacteria group bacterium]|nr:LamG domain-containing protein [Patescibacteria group bacterium]MDW8280052.1 LamG domain-containing protein [bacterium]
LINGPTWQTETNCKVGKCLSFDGVNDYVNINSSLNFPAFFNDRTVIVWTYQTFYTSTYLGLAHVFHYGNNQYNQSFGIATYNDNKFGAHEWLIYTRYGNIMLNNWNFLGITLSSHNIKKYYQNGNLIAINTSDPIPATNINYTPKIGSRVVPYEGFPGLIDEVRIYNRALSDSEIRAIYEATK